MNKFAIDESLAEDVLNTETAKACMNIIIITQCNSYCFYMYDFNYPSIYICFGIIYLIDPRI